jgi:hypothetical protein
VSKIAAKPTTFTQVTVSFMPCPSAPAGVGTQQALLVYTLWFHARHVSDRAVSPQERFTPAPETARGIQRLPADACVGIGGHEDVAPRTARAHGLREVTAERNCERDAMDRGEVVAKRRDGIKDVSTRSR